MDLADRNLAHPPYGEDHETPTEPADLVAAVHDADWPRALDLAKQEWLQLLCNHPNTRQLGDRVTAMSDCAA